MQQHLRNEAGQEMLVQRPSKTEACPVVSELQDIKSITIKVDLSIKVFLVKSDHGNLALAMIPSTIMFAVESQVVLDRPPGVFCFLVLSGRDGRCNGPKDYQNRNAGEQSKEDGGVEPP